MFTVTDAKTGRKIADLFQEVVHYPNDWTAHIENQGDCVSSLQNHLEYLIKNTSDGIVLRLS